MKTEVSSAIEELKLQFSSSAVTASEDGQGGAHVFLEVINLGPGFRPDHTWVGFQIPAQYPYADIYPIFISHDVSRVDGIPFAAPITLGHNFHGRAAIQISRRNGAAQFGQQKAGAKILKILDFLEHLP